MGTGFDPKAECQAKNEIYPVGIGNNNMFEQGHDIIDGAF